MKASEILATVPIEQGIGQCQYRLFDKDNNLMCAQAILLRGVGWTSWRISDTVVSSKSMSDGMDHFMPAALKLIGADENMSNESMKEASKNWKLLQQLNDDKKLTFIEISQYFNQLGY